MGQNELKDGREFVEIVGRKMDLRRVEDDPQQIDGI
jgi:hypothetical protein